MISDLSAVAFWWITLFLVGIIFLPTTWLTFKKFTDLGWGLSKTLGLSIVTFVFFVFSSIRLLPISQISILATLAIFLIINLVIYLKFRKEIIIGFKSRKLPILISEVLFVFGLFALSYVRAHNPDIRGLEKFMDFGFINSILRGQYLPPADMWYVGSSINYYWFGHLTTAILTKLTAIPSDITYNLMLGTILGVALSSAFSIVSSLFEKFGKKAAVAGILAALLLSFGGNFHTPYYALKNGYEKYWYPDATRFIGYNPDTNDKTIHEFPSYSFIVSDLHAHVLDFPFVLVFLALLLSQIKFTDRKSVLTPQLCFMGLVLGIMFSTSTWDFGIYLIVSSIALFTSNVSERGLSPAAIWHTIRPILIIILIGLGSASPFILNFDSIAQGINIVNAKTPLWQLLVLWGFPLLISTVYVLSLAKAKTISKSQAFILSLLTASWILIALPEIFYVKDIYSGSHQRANTMFKLTYQAFVMFYLSSGYIIVATVSSIKKLGTKLLVTAATSLIVSSILIYPYFGIKSYYGELKTYKGLSGSSWVLSFFPGEYEAIEWLNQNVSGQPTILEAPGDSYTDYNIISSYTGLPTVSGWFVHEWLWRGSAEIPQARVADITKIYNSTNLAESTKLINKYNIKYVVVGRFEKEKFPEMNKEKFLELGKIVYSQGETEIFKID